MPNEVCTRIFVFAVVGFEVLRDSWDLSMPIDQDYFNGFGSDCPFASILIPKDMGKNDRYQIFTKNKQANKQTTTKREPCAYFPGNMD